jgi:hypothetical protein
VVVAMMQRPPALVSVVIPSSALPPSCSYSRAGAGFELGGGGDMSTATMGIRREGGIHMRGTGVGGARVAVAALPVLPHQTVIEVHNQSMAIHVLKTKKSNSFVTSQFRTVPMASICT